jgi:hypothetical protein
MSSQVNISRREIYRKRRDGEIALAPSATYPGSSSPISSEASQLLLSLLDVDGAGSGLDADLLDGQHGSYYAPIDSPSFTTKINVTGDIFGSNRIVAGGLTAIDSEAQFQGKIDTTLDYQYLLRFKDEAGTIGLIISNGLAAGNFFPVFSGKVTSAYPAFYFVGNCVNGPGSGAPIIGFDGRRNNGAANADDILIGFSSGYGSLKAAMMGNGNWGMGFTSPLSKVSINGGLHVGGESDAGDNNLLVDGTTTILNTSDSAITNYGGVTKNNYASQLTGYRISASGEADFRYLYADELHVKSFIADLEQALAGGQIVAKSVAKVAADFTIPAAGASQTLVVEEFAGYTGAVFANGDTIRLRQFSRANNTTLNVADVWGTVIYVSRNAAANPTTQSFTFTRSAAPNAGSGSGTIKTGSLALDYGTSGNGYYEVTAVDGVNGVNSPYSQFVTWTGHPATGLTLKARIGNLAGITDADFGGALSGYGLYANNVYLKGNIQIVSGSVPNSVVTGLGSLATKSAVDLTTGEVINKSLANLDGTANTKLSGIAAGATVGATWGTNIGNQPSSLSAINSAEGTKLTGIAAGATVGATWGTNLYSIPATLGAPSGTGLFLSSTNMGYYSVGAWKTYIDNSGNMILGDIAGGNTGLSWNQATGVLSIKGAISITSGSVPNSVVTGLGSLATKSSVDLNSGEVINKSLANLDGTANTKLSSIAAGATVGATWGTNLYSIPNRIAYAGTPPGAGLYIGDTYMGYYDGGAWKSYIDSSGNCRFVGVASFGTQTVSVDAMSQNIALEGNDIWENSGANDGGSIRLNRIGLNGGTTKYRSVAIYDGKGHKLATFSGDIPGIHFGNSTDPINVDFWVYGTMSITGAIDFSLSPTIDFGSNHVVVTGTSDITCGASEGDMTSMSTSFTPKGDKILITFCASFYVTAANQTMWLIINVGGSNVRIMRSYIIAGYQPHAITYIANVTPNSAVTVKMRWSGGTAIQQRGSLDGARVMTITDIY